MTGFENWNCSCWTALTKGEVEMASVPTEAFSSSTVDTVPLSGARGLILILNFFPGSSSPSDSLDEKNVLALAGGGVQLRNTGLACVCFNREYIHIHRVLFYSAKCSHLYYTLSEHVKGSLWSGLGPWGHQRSRSYIPRVPCSKVTCTEGSMFPVSYILKSRFFSGFMGPWEYRTLEK